MLYGQPHLELAVIGNYRSPRGKDLRIVISDNDDWMAAITLEGCNTFVGITDAFSLIAAIKIPVQREQLMELGFHVE
jgi:hypothetical protein